VKICIHRGASEIGGSCVEISTSTTKVLIDIGLQLYGKKASIPKTSGECDAVLISHPHMDHYGLIDYLSENVPVYSGELGKRLIQASRLFTNKPLLKRDFIHFNAWESFEIGDLEITPYLVDHSATDAYAFLIEGDGKRVFYSGDFRAHGRKGVLFENMLKKPPKFIDVMLMEGTMLERDKKGCIDEKAVEEEFVNRMKKTDDLCFLLCSSQNIDRLVSAYRSALRSNRMFVVDIYTAWILNEATLVSKKMPTIQWNGVKVLSRGRTAARHYVVVKDNPDYFKNFKSTLYDKGNTVTIEEIARNPHDYLIKSNYISEILKDCYCDEATLLYSMWEGYLEEKYNLKGFKKLVALKNDPGIRFIPVHTSGHAYLSDLSRFADRMSPKMLVPIHTEHADQYKSCFSNVVQLEDGKLLILE
jgi:ribonuclease J